MKNNSIVLCFIVVTVATIVGGFVYDYVVDEIPKENQSEETINDIIEKERFTIEYDGGIGLSIYHDNELNVTCWSKAGSGGISCIHDSQLNMNRENVEDSMIINEKGTKYKQLGFKKIFSNLYVLVFIFLFVVLIYVVISVNIL